MTRNLKAGLFALMSAWVFSKQVQVETDKSDLYGRTVGKVMVGWD